MMTVWVWTTLWLVAGAAGGAFLCWVILKENKQLTLVDLIGFCMSTIIGPFVWIAIGFIFGNNVVLYKNKNDEEKNT